MSDCIPKRKYTDWHQSSAQVYKGWILGKICIKEKLFSLMQISTKIQPVVYFYLGQLIIHYWGSKSFHFFLIQSHRLLNSVSSDGSLVVWQSALPVMPRYLRSVIGEFATKPRQPTSIGYIFVSQPLFPISDTSSVYSNFFSLSWACWIRNGNLN